MKKVIFLILALVATRISAQGPLDTIYANDRKNVALFFPNPIRQGITGSTHFVFTYNREKEQHFGLLQAKPGPDSNLLTITNDGLVYSYILTFSDSLPKLSYFIDELKSIGNESPPPPLPGQKNQNFNSIKNRISEFEANCKQLLEYNDGYLATKRKKGIKLKLLNMTYEEAEVYMLIEVSNTSEIDFEVDFINVYLTNGNKERKASFQRLRQKVIYEYKIPNIIATDDCERFVYVLPKFVPGDNEKLMLEMQEEKGNRSIILRTKI